MIENDTTISETYKESFTFAHATCTSWVCFSSAPHHLHCGTGLKKQPPSGDLLISWPREKYRRQTHTMSLKAFAWNWFMSHSSTETSYAAKPDTNELGRNNLAMGKDDIYFEQIHNVIKWGKVMSLTKTRYGQLRDAGIDQQLTIQLQFICSYTGLATLLSQFPLRDTCTV